MRKELQKQISQSAPSVKFLEDPNIQIPFVQLRNEIMKSNIKLGGNLFESPVAQKRFMFTIAATLLLGVIGLSYIAATINNSDHETLTVAAKPNNDDQHKEPAIDKESKSNQENTGMVITTKPEEKTVSPKPIKIEKPGEQIKQIDFGNFGYPMDCDSTITLVNGSSLDSGYEGCGGGAWKLDNVLYADIISGGELEAVVTLIDKSGDGD